MLHLAFSHSALWLLPAAALAMGLAFAAYYRLQEALPRWLKGVLISLRALALFILLSLLIDPLLNRIAPINQPATVVILVDDSQSMVGSRDSASVGKELPLQVAALRDKLQSKGISVVSYTFSNELALQTIPNKQGFGGSITNLASALQQVHARHGGGHLGATVLFTDGIATAGASAPVAAQAYTSPLYTVLCGDTAVRKDLALEEVAVNEISYFNTQTPIWVSVRSQGYPAGPCTVQLLQAGRLVATQQLALPRDGLVTTEFKVQLSQVGQQFYQVQVVGLPGELTYRNNTQAVSIQVLENRLHITLLGGSPHPDVGALAACFGSDARIQFQSYLKKNEQEFYTPLDKDVLAKTDLFILYNYPSTPADRPLLDKVFDEVAKRKLPLWHFIGTQTGFNVSPRQPEFTPLFPQGVTSMPATEAFLYLTQGYRQHATYPTQPGFERWLAGAPPLLRNPIEWVPQPGSQVVGQAMVKGIALPYPMLALQEVGGRKAIAWLGENFWRYRMYSYTETTSFENFDSWMRNLAQWLAVRADKRQFKVSPTQPLFSGTEQVRFKAEVYDESYQTIAGAEVKLILLDSQQRALEYFFTEAQPGSYSLAIASLPEGTYRYQAVGQRQGKPLGRDAGIFTVGKSTLEFVDLQANAPLLRQLALATGGRFTTLQHANNLAAKLLQEPSLKPLVEYRRTSTRLHDYWLPMVVVLSLLGAEWVLRKRFGLA